VSRTKKKGISHDPKTGNKSTSGREKTKKKGKNNTNNAGSIDNDNMVNLNQLTPEGIEQLKSLLGLSRPQLNESINDDGENEQVFASNSPIHDHEGPSNPRDTSFSREKLVDKLFGSDDSDDENDGDLNNDVWSQPLLKAPDLGDPIAKSLADLINTACTNQCKVNDVIGKYKVPSNCEFMNAPRVNEEIWGELVRNRRVQTNDKLLRDIQNLVTAGMIPILTLAKVLKPYTSQVPELKTLIGDSLTLLGQVQFNMSVRRRYMLKPYLKVKYANICNINTPVSSWLFGDDIGKEIKKCETIVKVGKNYSFNRTSMNKSSTSSFGPIRGARGRGTYGRRPYARPGGMTPNRQQGYGQFGHQHNFSKRRSAATHTVSSADNPN
jgi:hypothetical protein